MIKFMEKFTIKFMKKFTIKFTINILIQQILISRSTVTHEQQQKRQMDCL